MAKKTIGYPKLKRLIHLRTLVENTPSKKFCMSRWVSDYLGTKCAGGLACTDPDFNKKGLTYNGGGPELSTFSYKVRDRKGNLPSDDLYSDQLAQFFGLNYRQAEKLFCDPVAQDQRQQRLEFLGNLNRIISREYARRAVAEG